MSVSDYRFSYLDSLYDIGTKTSRYKSLLLLFTIVLLKIVCFLAITFYFCSVVIFPAFSVVFEVSTSDTSLVSTLYNVV